MSIFSRAMRAFTEMPKIREGKKVPFGANRIEISIALRPGFTEQRLIHAKSSFAGECNCVIV